MRRKQTHDRLGRGRALWPNVLVQPWRWRPFLSKHHQVAWETTPRDERANVPPGFATYSPTPLVGTRRNWRALSRRPPRSWRTQRAKCSPRKLRAPLPIRPPMRALSCLGSGDSRGSARRRHAPRDPRPEASRELAAEREAILLSSARTYCAPRLPRRFSVEP